MGVRYAVWAQVGGREVNDQDKPGECFRLHDTRGNTISLSRDEAAEVIEALREWLEEEK